MIGFWNGSVYMTYAGLLSAVAGIFLSVDGKLTPAIFCLLFSGLCDTFDGRIARAMKRTEDEKAFGIQIDSLCDLVCFGVFPAVLANAMGVAGLVGKIVLALFVLMGQVRLAYYNVTEEKRQKVEEGKRKYYQGLPITMSCLMLPAFYVLRPFLGAAAPYVLTVCMGLLGLMYVLNLRVPKPGRWGTALMLGIGILIAAGAVVLLIVS